MSYILDALRKADRERRQPRAPTLEAIHPVPAAPRRRLWPWVAAGAVAANAVVVVAVMYSIVDVSPPVDPGRDGGARPAATSDDGARPMAAPTARSVTTSTEATRQPSKESEPRTTGQPAVTPRVASPPAPRTGVISDAKPVASGGRVVADSRVAPQRAPAVAGPDLPPASQLEPAPRVTTPAASPVPRAIARPPVGPTAVAQGTPPAAAAAPPTAPPTDARLAITRPSDPAPRPAAPSRAGLISFRELPPVFRDTLPKLKLEVLAYSERAPERLVFINGQKYVEGGWVEGKILVEEITQDGAILSHQGQRFLLRE